MYNELIHSIIHPDDSPMIRSHHAASGRQAMVKCSGLSIALWNYGATAWLASRDTVIRAWAKWQEADGWDCAGRHTKRRTR